MMIAAEVKNNIDGYACCVERTENRCINDMSFWFGFLKPRSKTMFYLAFRRIFIYEYLILEAEKV